MNTDNNVNVTQKSKLTVKVKQNLTNFRKKITVAYIAKVALLTAKESSPLRVSTKKQQLLFRLSAAATFRVLLFCLCTKTDPVPHRPKQSLPRLPQVFSVSRWKNNSSEKDKRLVRFRTSLLSYFIL